MTRPTSTVEVPQTTRVLEELVCFDLYAASRAMTRRYRPLLEKHGLTYPQYLVVVVLGGAGASSIKQLAGALRLEHATLTPLLRRMEDAELVRRQRDPEDGRSYLLDLTERGRDVYAAADDVQCQITDDLGLSQARCGSCRSRCGASSTRWGGRWIRSTEPRECGARRRAGGEVVASGLTGSTGPYDRAMDYQGILAQVLADIEPQIGLGQVATHIPALGTVDPNQFGMAVADLDGNVTGVGAFDVPFSAQSITKVFALALVIASEEGNFWSRVGREPSGSPYNSLVQLEVENGIPRNPFINAGALVTTDRLLSLKGDARGAVRTFLQEESGNPALDFDRAVAESEVEHGARNAALGYFMASHDNMENPVPAGAGALLLAVLDPCQLPGPGAGRWLPRAPRRAGRRHAVDHRQRRQAHQRDHAHVRHVRRSG